MKLSPHHDHDLGLQHDLERIAAQTRQRRRVLSWMLAGGTAALVAACGGGGDDSSTASTSSGSSSGSTSTGTTTTTTTSGTCMADPEETQGPFPGDGSNTVSGQAANVLNQSGIVRSDIRSSLGSSTTTAPGVPLELTLTLVNSNQSCAVLANAAIYIWHCTRDGQYSLYGSSVLNENFLRGVQVTDANGQVKFTTVYPGCYSGRYPHIHFEVYSSLAMASLYTNKILTSQMAMPRDVSSAVYSGTSGYSASVSNLSQITTSNDNVFGDNTAAQIAFMTPSISGDVTNGFTGTLTIGVPA